ncbi:TPA: amidohydrolase [Candidatus Bathyarchaeota archaeon]|nr:amidohydrolase [Candidatus Bathyarchaeota archaeon]
MPSTYRQKDSFIIIDAHTHLGYDHVFEHNFTLHELLTSMEKNGVDASIVQPGTTLDLSTALKQHDAIAELSKKMSGRIFGMANPNPHLPQDVYYEELKRCVKNLGFVGVKMHPLAHAVNPNGLTGRRVFEAALDLEIPVMVHTGTGVPWSLPSALIPVAKDFPELNIILAHSGGSLFVSEAILAAQLCPNIYLETSWLPSTAIRKVCKSLGANRVMFGSDHGGNVATELTKFKTISLNAGELEWCLGRTAMEIFKISA